MPIGHPSNNWWPLNHAQLLAFNYSRPNVLILCHWLYIPASVTNTNTLHTQGSQTLWITVTCVQQLQCLGGGGGGRCWRKILQLVTVECYLALYGNQCSNYVRNDCRGFYAVLIYWIHFHTECCWLCDRYHWPWQFCECGKCLKISFIYIFIRYS